MKTNKFGFTFGTSIYAQDRHIGELERVVVNTEATHITHIILSRGTLFKKALVLPFSIIEATDSEGISLAISSDELVDYPTFTVKRLKSGVSHADVSAGQKDSTDVRLQSVDHQPHGDAALYVEEQTVRQGVGPEQLVWSAQTAVHSYQGKAGELYQVIVWPDDGRVHELIMRQGKLPEKFLIVPSELIERGQGTQILLKLDEKEIAALIESFNFVPESTTSA